METVKRVRIEEAQEAHLVEERLVGAVEGPLDVVVADVEHLALGLHVSVVPIGAACAREGRLLRRLQRYHHHQRHHQGR